MNKFLILLSFIFLIACVPMKQFQDLQNQQKDTKEELLILQNSNRELDVQNNELTGRVSSLEKKVKELVQDTLRLAKENWNLKNRNADLQNQYNDLIEKYNSGGGDEKSTKLLSHLQGIHEQLQDREDALRKAEQELSAKKSSLDAAESELGKTKGELEARNKRLSELEKALGEKDRRMNALRNAIAEALTGFSDDELAVHIKNGKVYVSMEEKLLFQSGSYQVSTFGVDALRKIATVLEQKSDINIIVEGHTDNVPYKSAILLDNWDLSVKRSTSVIRIILENSSVSPERIMAAGRSEFVPIENSNTPEARRKNRRTEIILTPKLDQLLNLLETN